MTYCRKFRILSDVSNKQVINIMKLAVVAENTETFRANRDLIIKMLTVPSFC